MPRHIPSLDGLRAIAVLLVMWCHVPMHFAGYPEWLRVLHHLVGPGGLGVDLFFALSGFLITRILLAERAIGAPVRWFLIRRMLRIFPIYYLLLLVLLPFRPASEIGWCSLYLSNFVWVLYPTTGLQPLGHTWSLCVEEHFYLVWPLVLAATSLATARRVLVFGVIPIALFGAVVVGFTCEHSLREAAVQHMSPFRFPTLAAGALLAFAESQATLSPRRLRALGAGLVTLALALHPHLWFLVVPLFWLQATWWPLELAPAAVRLHSTLLCTGLLCWSLLPLGTFASPARMLSVQPLRWIGRISYGLYLYHFPIYQLVLAEHMNGLAVALAVALTFAVAALSFVAIELPILRFAGRFRQRPAASSL